MRISDWSSDVCSSDLTKRGLRGIPARPVDRRGQPERRRIDAGRGEEVADILVEPAHRHIAVGRVIPFRRQVDILRFIGDQARIALRPGAAARSEEHTSELQSLMRISYAVYCLKKKIQSTHNNNT